MIMLCYHDLTRDETNPWTLHPTKFREQLKILRDRDYRLIGITELKNEAFRDPKSVIITFDDGRAGCYQFAAEILAEFGCEACFYISTDFAEGKDVAQREQYSRFMNWDEIQLLRDLGHTIGSHAMTHRSFRELESQERLHELVTSKQIIEERLNCACRHFAAPYGYSDAELAESARTAGYASLVTTVFGSNKSNEDSHKLKRWEIHSQLTAIDFEQKLESLAVCASQFKVLSVSSLTLSSKLELSPERIAQYDLIVATESEVLELAQRFGIHCVIPQSRTPDEGTICDPSRMAEWVAKYDSRVQGLHVVIDVL